MAAPMKTVDVVKWIATAIQLVGYGLTGMNVVPLNVFDLTPNFHPAGTRDRELLSRRSAGEATAGMRPVRC